MGDFLERYRGGEHETVWSELLALGPRVRDETVLSDALAVAHETMCRARHNVELFVPRLKSIGFQFGALVDDPTYWQWLTPFTPPPPDVGNAIDEMERLAGVMPLSLRAWYEVVGQVSFLGFHPDWPDTFALDPLHVDPITGTTEDDTYTDYHQSEYEEWQANCREFGAQATGAFCITIAPDEYHKANISGGPPYCIALPCEAVDAPLMYEWHQTTFVHYLRTCFRWGGFPGLERCEEKERPLEHLAYLTQDLLPL